MLDKLRAVEARYEQLSAEMADPAVQADTSKFRTHSKALSEMQPLVDAFREYKSVVEQVAATQELLKDPDMRELAQDELTSLESRRDHLLNDIKQLLIPQDPND
jgi:peptide chain release factor 1